MLISVALPVPLPQNFYYNCPSDLANQANIGARVLVPFGRRKLVGIIVDFPIQSTFAPEQLKDIIQILDSTNIFPQALWQLLHWGASYYHAPLGEMLIHALPTKLRQGEVLPNWGKILLKITILGKQALDNNQLQRSKKQQQALELCSRDRVIKGENPFSANIWKALLEKNLVTEEREIFTPIPWHKTFSKLEINSLVKLDNQHQLNQEQVLALSLLEKVPSFKSWLLQGVTGSGKTEIYLQFLTQILTQGKQALVLVPEINLTPQTLNRFQNRFQVPVELVHSQLSDTERLAIWQRVKTEQIAILIGTRSALFAPFQNLGAIIVDEEHDRSFKQMEGIRYNARDMAIMYAKIWNIPIVLGSATPSLESLHNAQTGKYGLITLHKRAGKGHTLHHFVIDMQKQVLREGISLALVNKIQEHLDKNGQVLLFLNRRGYAPVLLCHECGWIDTCKYCDKPFTYHHKARVLRCHHCGGQRTIPPKCPNCGSTYLISTGLGTEQLEKNLHQLFPQVQISRVDRDTTARKGELEKSLNLILNHQSQILIGTQMLAKGHHFPEVSLVALLDIDGALFASDFRAEEQLAQLYVQVAGRAGRAERAGEVVLQTHFPEHPLLQSLLTQGYLAFAQSALEQRQALDLPPYCFQALLGAKSKIEQEGQEFLEKIRDFFQQLVADNPSLAGLQILPVMPASMAKKAGFYRWHLLLQHFNRSLLQQALNLFPQEQFLKSKVQWYLDVDPVDFS